MNIGLRNFTPDGENNPEVIKSTTLNTHCINKHPSPAVYVMQCQLALDAREMEKRGLCKCNSDLALQQRASLLTHHCTTEFFCYLFTIRNHQLNFDQIWIKLKERFQSFHFFCALLVSPMSRGIPQCFAKQFAFATYCRKHVRALHCFQWVFPQRLNNALLNLLCYCCHLLKWQILPVRHCVSPN